MWARKGMSSVRKGVCFRRAGSEVSLIRGCLGRDMKTLRKKWGLVDMKGRAFLVGKRAMQKPCKNPAVGVCAVDGDALSGRGLSSHCARAQLLSPVRLFVAPGTGASQAPLFMGFPRQEYWSGLPFPSPGHLPHPKIKPASPALAGGFFTTEPPRRLIFCCCCCYIHLFTFWISHLSGNTVFVFPCLTFHSTL